MDEECSLNDIDGLLFQCAQQTRELCHQRNEINQQIKVYRAVISERRSYIETINRNISKLEEEIKAKQTTVIRNKEMTKSCKVTSSLLLQYEQTLKAELESRKTSYYSDMEVYEERIASYRDTFQSLKEHYCQNPHAQKLLGLQVEIEEIQCRIKACDDQITTKQTELDHLTGPALSSAEKLPDSVSGQPPMEEPEKQLGPQTVEDSDPAIDISSLHLNQKKMLQGGQEVSVKAYTEDIHQEHNVEDSTVGSPHPEEVSSELWSYEQVDEQSWPDEMQTDEQEKELEGHVLEQQPTASEAAGEVEERASTVEDQTSSEEDNEGLDDFPRPSSQRNTPEPSPAKMTAPPLTPTYPFNYSPISTVHQGSSDTASPAFPFSLKSDPSTPGFVGFGSDEGTSQDTSFGFSGSFFSEKKTAESKSSSFSEFLFGQSEQRGDFQFGFSSKSPETTNKEHAGNEFPFSLNF